MKNIYVHLLADITILFFGLIREYLIEKEIFIKKFHIYSRSNNRIEEEISLNLKTLRKIRNISDYSRYSGSINDIQIVKDIAKKTIMMIEKVHDENT